MNHNFKIHLQCMKSKICQLAVDRMLHSKVIEISIIEKYIDKLT